MIAQASNTVALSTCPASSMEAIKHIYVGHQFTENQDVKLKINLLLSSKTQDEKQPKVISATAMINNLRYQDMDILYRWVLKRESVVNNVNKIENQVSYSASPILKINLDTCTLTSATSNTKWVSCSLTVRAITKSKQLHATVAFPDTAIVNENNSPIIAHTVITQPGASTEVNAVCLSQGSTEVNCQSKLAEFTMC